MGILGQMDAPDTSDAFKAIRPPGFGLVLLPITGWTQWTRSGVDTWTHGCAL